MSESNAKVPRKDPGRERAGDRFMSGVQETMSQHRSLDSNGDERTANSDPRLELEEIRNERRSLERNTPLDEAARAVRSQELAVLATREEQTLARLDEARREHTRRRVLRNLKFRQRVAGKTLTFEPEQQPLFKSEDGTDHQQLSPVEHHDVLVVAPKGVHGRRNHFRFPVRKVAEAAAADPAAIERNAATGRVGSYDQPPELLGEYDISARAFEMLARPQDFGPAAFRKTERGPVFATIPVKPEPGGSDCAICYLVNAQNLNYRNAWTAEEWSDVPDGPDLPPTRNVDATTMEVLLAGPRGLVFRLNLFNLDEVVPGDRIPLTLDRESPVEAGSLTCIDLAPQMEIWQQLRSGCVMGRVLFDSDGTKRVVPLINITSLLPE
jgi:hypothetical protein